VNCAKFSNFDCSAVRIYKHCLQTASAFGELRPPDTLMGLCPWTLLGD